MNFSKLLLVTMVTAGALSLTGQATAFAPNWTADKDDGSDGFDRAATAVLWHAGASASTSSLQRAVLDAFCDPTDPINRPITILEDARSYQSLPGSPAGGPAGVARPAFWTVACTTKAGIGANIPANKKIMWSKRDEGGSGVGVGPLAGNNGSGVPIAFMKPNTGPGPDGTFSPVFAPNSATNDDTNCPGNGALNSGGTLTNVYSRTVRISDIDYNTTVHNCINFTYRLAGPPTAAVTSETGVSDDAVTRIPDIGTSDIEPDKFFAGGLNDPVADFDLNGIPELIPSTPAPDVIGYFGTSNTQPVAYLTFGIPVNLLMYQDLQRMQFPAGHPLFASCNPVGAQYGSIADPRNNANSERCMPSLTSNEIRSIFSSQAAIRLSTDLQFKSTYNGALVAGPASFSRLSATVNGASNDAIQICRRVNGSGTQAQANAIFMGYPCDINTDGSIDTLNMTSETIPGATTINNEGSGDVELCLNDFNNGANATGRNPTPFRRWAIGIQSLERNAPNFTTNTYANAYRFIKIDGFAPTIANVHAGDYYDFAAQSLQFRSTAPIAPANVREVARDAWTTLGLTIRDVTVLPGLNRLHAFGTASWLAIPTVSLKPDEVLDLARPVSWYRRVSFNGTRFNTCALPSMFNAKPGAPTRVNNSATVGPQNCSNTSVGGSDNNCYTDPNPINGVPTE